MNWLFINETSCYEGYSMLENLYYCKYNWVQTWTNIGYQPTNCLNVDNIMQIYCKSLMVCMNLFNMRFM